MAVGTGGSAKHRRLVLSWAVAFAAGAALAADYADITRERYPDADSVVANEIERVAYNPDGGYERLSESWTKILTEKGRRDESVVSIRYSKRYGDAEVQYVGAIGENGEEREIDVSATTSESTDNGSMSANIYDPLDRKIVCRIPGLKVGEVVHVKTRRRNLRPRCEGKWSDLCVMEWSCPMVSATYEVTAPAELPLKRIAVRHPIGNITSNQTRRADGSVVHVFTVTNSPQAFAEPDMPPLYTQMQNVRVSTAEDWPEISRWYWNLCAPHMAKTNAAMAAKVEELGRDIRRIFTFVSQEIRYMGLTMEDTSPGYSPHDIDITFANRYGVCRDKAALLVAMLRMAGHNAFPVLIHVGAKHDPEVPQPFFNHAIVAVEKEEAGERYMLMDPTNENAKDLFPAYESDKSYLVCRPEGDILRTSPVPSAEHNSVRASSRGTLAKDGSIFFETEIRFNGINDTGYRGALVRKTPEDRVKFFERVAKSLAAGAELVRCEVLPKDMRDTDSPLVVRFAANLPESLLRGETRDELNVPFVTRSLGFANFLLSGSTSLDRRRFPLAIDSTAGAVEDVELDLGGAVGEASDLPSASASAEGYAYARNFSVSNGVLRARRSLSVSRVEFDPEAYGALREAIKSFEAAERRRPVFAVDPVADADVRRILSSVEAEVHSDTAWTTTNSVVAEVLTYQGKKALAELKLTYNPSVESLGLLSAVVSNADGTVRHVSDHEINVMDCSWAAAAPRYPASKIIVVSLPSVEIGSTISYTYVRAVTNAPAPFYAVYGFDSHEPLERCAVRVNGWRREVVKPRRVPDEPSQPSASLWRDQVIVSSNRFEAVDLRVSPFVSPLLPSPLDLRSARDWMAKYVKVAGPGLYEIPLSRHLTDPETVLKERYASRLDYVRTLCALLRGAGYKADVVFAADDADDPPEVRERIMRLKPNVRAFSAPLCRVTVREGGFLCFGGEEKTYFIGTENEYSPLGPSGYEGCDYFDPETAEFGVVTVPEPEMGDRAMSEIEILVRENGSVDMTVSKTTWGPGVGAFRRKWDEILPEERQRLYQSILGDVAQAATATSDLETDVASYPAKLGFSCFVPDFAVVSGDAITLQIPSLISSIPTYTGKSRRTPFAVGEAERKTQRFVVKFPEGYTLAERLPESFSFADPLDPGRVWLECRVESSVRDGRLEVRVEREVHRRGWSWYKPDFIELVRDRSRIAGSRASRTIVVRRAR